MFVLPAAESYGVSARIGSEVWGSFQGGFQKVRGCWGYLLGLLFSPRVLMGIYQHRRDVFVFLFKRLQQEAWDSRIFSCPFEGTSSFDHGSAWAGLFVLTPASSSPGWLIMAPALLALELFHLFTSVV